MIKSNEFLSDGGLDNIDRTRYSVDSHTAVSTAAFTYNNMLFVLTKIRLAHDDGFVH